MQVPWLSQICMNAYSPGKIIHGLFIKLSWNVASSKQHKFEPFPSWSLPCFISVLHVRLVRMVVICRFDQNSWFLDSIKPSYYWFGGCIFLLTSERIQPSGIFIIFLFTSRGIDVRATSISFFNHLVCLMWIFCNTQYKKREKNWRMKTPNRSLLLLLNRTKSLLSL